MALINFYKGLKENYSPDTHGNSIYSCTDTNECYILGVLYENISEEEITNKIGTNTYTGANYISKETNLTDAAMQLDEEIKATNDNIDILNAATVKSVKVGSNTSNEAFSNGVITIANATTSTDGALSKEDKTKLDNIESTYLPLTGGTITGIVRHSANIDLDNGKYIEAYTTGGQQYPVLFIDSEDDFVVGSNGIETRIRSNDSNLIHDTTSGRYTIYDSNNLDITKWNISQLTTSVDNVTSSGIKYYNVASGNVENLPIEDSSYGIVGTFAKLDNTNPGTNNTWGFQLASPNNSDSLWYRSFKGLSKNSWKELATKEDTKSLVFTLSESANEDNAANYTKVLAGNHNISLNESSGNYFIPNSIQTGTSGQIGITYVTFTETGYQSVKWTVLADGTCTKELSYSFTIPSVNLVSEFPTELDNYADGSIFIKE